MATRRQACVSSNLLPNPVATNALGLPLRLRTHHTTMLSRLGLNPLLRPVVARSILARVPQPAARLVSTSSARAATPASGPVQVGGAPAGPKRPTHAESEHLPLVDYSKGPSALDKAANVFFFTEILRGELDLRSRGLGRAPGCS